MRRRWYEGCSDLAGIRMVTPREGHRLTRHALRLSLLFATTLALTTPVVRTAGASVAGCPVFPVDHI
ncbi:MAG TPA: hypothetical protein VGW35_13210, partial [Methylomirabilota bacterium]|nr:hypothetical protein [Methylomirabilota bacterium]